MNVYYVKLQKKFDSRTISKELPFSLASSSSLRKLPIVTCRGWPIRERDGNENVISHFNRFVAISIFLIWQRCGSSSKMTLVGTALNLGKNMKIYHQVLTSLIKPQIWLFHVVLLLTTAKKWTQVKNARAGRARLFFWLIKYANFWRSCSCRRCHCLSSLMFQNKSFLCRNNKSTMIRHNYGGAQEKFLFFKLETNCFDWEENKLNIFNC